MPTPARGTPLLQINEEDLATLEHILPEVAGRLYPQMDSRLRTQLRQVQTILSKARWNYGPPGEVEVDPPTEPPESGSQIGPRP